MHNGCCPVITRTGGFILGNYMIPLQLPAEREARVTKDWKVIASVEKTHIYVKYLQLSKRGARNYILILNFKGLHFRYAVVHTRT